MNHQGRFYGITTVGERGQIVLPVNLRKDYIIKTGDKLMVLGMPSFSGNTPGQIMIIKAEVLNRMISHMQEHEKELRKILSQNNSNKPLKRKK